MFLITDKGNPRACHVYEKYMADCMDAATDFIGRSYRGQKTFDKCLEEFMQGRGSVYATEIVDLIEQDKKLQSDLRHLLTEGRIQTYYEIYGMVLDQNDAAEEEECDFLYNMSSLFFI